MWLIVSGIALFIVGLIGSSVAEDPANIRLLMPLGIVLFAFGLSSKFSAWLQKQKQLGSLRLLHADAALMAFLQRTHEAWASGRIDSPASPRAVKRSEAAAIPCEEFVARQVQKGDWLHVMSSFSPREDEYLVDLGIGMSLEHNDVQSVLWFILTNSRLIQKDGASRRFSSIALANIQSYEVIDTFLKKEYVFNLTSGKTVRFSKLECYPTKELLDFARRLSESAPSAPAIIVCTQCGTQLDYMGVTIHMGQWRGNVCVPCGLVLCPRCIEVGLPSPCPKCQQETAPALSIRLREAGIGL